MSNDIGIKEQVKKGILKPNDALKMIPEDEWDTKPILINWLKTTGKNRYKKAREDKAKEEIKASEEKKREKNRKSKKDIKKEMKKKNKKKSRKR